MATYPFFRAGGGAVPQPRKKAFILFFIQYILLVLRVLPEHAMRFKLLSRPSRKKWNKKRILSGRRPMRRGIVSRARDDVTTKKPHSAKRKVAAFYIQYKKYLKNRAYMPGENVKGQLKKYDTIFFNGNRRRDVPALKYTIVYGVHTSGGQGSTRVTGISYRRKARSKYGLKHELEEPVKVPGEGGVDAEDGGEFSDDILLNKDESVADSEGGGAEDAPEGGSHEFLLSVFSGDKFQPVGKFDDPLFYKEVRRIYRKDPFLGRWNLYKLLDGQRERKDDRARSKGHSGGLAFRR